MPDIRRDYRELRPALGARIDQLQEQEAFRLATSAVRP